MVGNVSNFMNVLVLQTKDCSALNLKLLNYALVIRVYKVLNVNDFKSVVGYICSKCGC